MYLNQRKVIYSYTNRTRQTYLLSTYLVIRNVVPATQNNRQIILSLQYNIRSNAVYND